MKRLHQTITALLLTAMALPAIAQDATRETAPAAASEVPAAQMTRKQDRILLIPYDPKLYMSGIDQKIAEKTGLTHQQIRNRMRFGLNVNMFASADQVMPTISILDSEDPEVQKDLGYIYNSIGYKYSEMPAEATAEEQAPEKGIDKLKGKINKFVEQERANRDRPLGEEVQEPEPEKFMKTTIINPNLLTYLSNKYEVDVFLFINQLDISSEVREGGYSYAQQKNKRKIKIHYTIFDVSGKELYASASVVYFPATVNDLNGIIKGYFPEAAATIAKHLPVKEEAPETPEQEPKEPKATVPVTQEHRTINKQ